MDDVKKLFPSAQATSETVWFRYSWFPDFFDAALWIVAASLGMVGRRFVA
jgi:ABC-type nitrate/sulfonate/bicarbonate transport system substrate-binding protein